MVGFNAHNRHSATEDLHKVHTILKAKFILQKEAAVDIARAKKMEEYLRLFKALGNQHNDTIQPQYQTELEAEAVQDIATKVGQALGIGQYSLFRNQHLWYKDAANRWGVDDVFEAELAKLLEVAAKEITGDSNVGVATVGKQLGNINLIEIEKLPENICKQFYKKIPRLIRSTRKKSTIITPPEAKSGKTDIIGYNSTWKIETSIQPEWQNFFTVFTGAKFSVKNYSSTSKNEVIHLGNTDLRKAFYGTLRDYLHFNEEDAVHIYFHTINTQPLKDDMGEHIVHIRFIYELTGVGLYDQDHNKLDTVDFFIYNDPSSNDIFVRSTKAMIASIMDYVGDIRDPLHSGIVILKSSF